MPETDPNTEGPMDHEAADAALAEDQQEADAPAVAPIEPEAEPTPEERLADAEDRALRLQAELQNVYARTNRQIADEKKYGAIGLVRDLLPAIDNIDRALEAAEQSEGEAGPLLEGFKLVRQQLITVLGQHGCEPIATDDADFDPELHEAILQQPSPDAPAGKVLMTTQAGYRLHDRVVRPAQVIVSSGAPGN